MKTNSIVVVNLHTPKEKFWGILEELSPAGITLQGIDLNTFEDFVRQASTDEPLGFTTVFFPLYRVERMALDEPMGDIPSLIMTFEQRTQQTLQTFLGSLAG